MAQNTDLCAADENQQRKASQRRSPTQQAYKLDIWPQNSDIWPQNIYIWLQNIDIWPEEGR